MQIRPVFRRRLFFGVLAALLTIPATVQAATTSDVSARVDVTSDDALIGLYPYGSGSVTEWTSQPDFAAGSHAGTSDNVVVGSLTLERSIATDPDSGLAAWWDDAWIVRQCFEIDHTDPMASNLLDHPLRLSPSLPSLAGVRAIGSDDATVLPHWVDGADVWVKVDAIPAGTVSHLCIYGDNPVASETSDVVSAVTSALAPAYVTVSENAVGRSVTVMSYTDGNVVSSGSEIVYGLDAGESFTFTTGITSATVFSTLGPIAGRVLGQGADALVPLDWAGTEFVFPSTRGTQRFSVYAPTAAATVTFYRGSNGSTVTLPVAAGTTEVTNADGGGRAVIATSDQPVLITHEGTNNRDVYPAYPATTADLYGVPSTRHYLSTTTNGTAVAVWRSDGTTQAFALNRFIRRTVTPNGGTYGTGPAARITGSSPLGTIQQADGNGSESTTFLPQTALASRYYLPTTATYVAFACPTPGTVIDVVPPAGAPGSVTCAGAGLPAPGKARVGVTAPGTLVRSQGGEAFYAYYQDDATNDETNLVGPLGTDRGWPAPTISPRPAAGIYRATGTWTGPVVDTGGDGVFGELAWTATVPADTTVRFQVATSAAAGGPFTYVGPDGTVGSSYAHPGPGSAIFDYTHDGNRFARVRVYLDTTNPIASPRLDDVSIESNLTPAATAPGGPVVVTVPSDGGLHHLLRVRTGTLDHGPSAAHLEHRSAANLANLAAAEVRFDLYPAAQLEYAAGVVVTPAGPDEPFNPPDAYSLILEETTVAAGESTLLEISWRLDVAAGATTYLERLVEVTINS